MDKIEAIYQKHLERMKAQYQNIIDREIADLEAQLATIDAKQERHDAECERTSGFRTNPAGDIGGIRSRSKKQKQQLFERWSRQARTTVDLLEQRRRIVRDIEAKKQIIPRKAREAAANEILQLIIRPGDKVSVPWSDSGTVVRVNKKSVTVQTALVKEPVKWNLIGLHNWKELARERLD